jgi:DNA-directed RNA polymerase subunit L
MEPRVENVLEDGNVLQFTLSNVNVSIANALRRTVISNIPTVVFKTTPYEENKANITVNTSRLNNEILKQRLSCIPIHIRNLNMPLENLRMELNVENKTDTILYVTTEDFKIKDLGTNEYLSAKDQQEIFPPNDLTGYYIDFARLRPRISDEIPGEKLQMTCEFSIGTCKEDGMFNAVSVCAYGYTQDKDLMETELEKKRQQWKDDGLSKEKIEFESKNWTLLDGERVIRENSFDFTVESVGVFANQELIKKACHILITKLSELSATIDTSEIDIHSAENTMKHCYDIILENEDYTIGKVLEYLLYTKFFQGVKTLSYCGFKKMHPHDANSIIRLAYKEDTEITTIKQNLKMCIEDAEGIYKSISKKF